MRPTAWKSFKGLVNDRKTRQNEAWKTKIWIKNENTKKCIFSSFLSLRWTAWRPFRLSNIDSMHQFILLIQGPIPAIFGKKYWELGWVEKLSFFWVGHFDGFFSRFFLSYPYKNQSMCLEKQGRDIHIECSKQFKWNSFFYVSGQNRPFWAVLKLL